MMTLSINQVKLLHERLIFETGGAGGIRDEALLDSALSAPFQTFDGADLFPTVIAKISRIVYGIVCNHPFIDGNKRIGTYVLLILLELNNIEVVFSDADIIRIGLDLANGKMNDKQLLAFILERFH